MENVVVIVNLQARTLVRVFDALLDDAEAYEVNEPAISLEPGGGLAIWQDAATAKCERKGPSFRVTYADGDRRRPVLVFWIALGKAVRGGKVLRIEGDDLERRLVTFPELAAFLT